MPFLQHHQGELPTPQQAVCSVRIPHSMTKAGQHRRHSQHKHDQQAHNASPGRCQQINKPTPCGVYACQDNTNDDKTLQQCCAALPCHGLVFVVAECQRPEACQTKWASPDCAAATHNLRISCNSNQGCIQNRGWVPHGFPSSHIVYTGHEATRPRAANTLQADRQRYTQNKLSEPDRHHHPLEHIAAYR